MKADQQELDDLRMDQKLKELEQKLQKMGEVENEPQKGLVFKNAFINAQKPKKKPKKKPNKEKPVEDTEDAKEEHQEEEIDEGPSEPIVEQPIEPKQIKPIPEQKLKKQQKPEKSKPDVKQSRNDQMIKNEQAQGKGFKIGFLIVIGLLLLLSYFVLKKYQKYLLPATKDYYDLLEIEQTASQSEIKQQFKKLALKYHPDKNKDCGTFCEIRIQEINNAYEILGNEDRRKIYDSTVGGYSEILSKSQTLKASVFNSEVIQSEDVWILQVFSNGNQMSQYFSSNWEQVVEQLLQSPVKMARINLKDKDKFYWLSSLKISEDNMPLVFSYSKYMGFSIASIEFSRAELSLKQFIRNSIPLFLEYLTEGNIDDILEKSKRSLKPSIFFFNTQSRTPINLLGLAFQLKDYVQCYVNRPDQTIPPLQARLNKTKCNVVLILPRYTAPDNFQCFTVDREMNDVDLEPAIQRIRSESAPVIYKNRLLSFCEGPSNQEVDLYCVLYNSKIYSEAQALSNPSKHQQGLIDFDEHPLLTKVVSSISSKLVHVIIINSAKQQFSLLYDGEVPENFESLEFDYFNRYHPINDTHELFSYREVSFIERMIDFFSLLYRQDPYSIYMVFVTEVIILWKVKAPDMKYGSCLVILFSFISYSL